MSEKPCKQESHKKDSKKDKKCPKPVVAKKLDVCGKANFHGPARFHDVTLFEKPATFVEGLSADKVEANHVDTDSIVLKNRGTIVAEGYIPTNNLTLPILDGPYSVDHFQIARDNVQVRTPVKYRVDQVPDLKVTGVQKITVDGIEYFGRLENDKPVYLSYPLPLTLDVYVPSIRTDKNKTYDFFPDPDSDNYGAYFPLNYQLLSDATNFNVNGELTQTSLLYAIGEMNYVAPGDNLGVLLVNKPVSDWDGLKDKFLLDLPNVSAYDRLVAVIESLKVSITGPKIQQAYILLCKIIGSYGVPVEDGNKNSVRQTDRLQAYNLILSSTNYTRYKQYQTYALRHGIQANKDVSDIYQPKYDFNNINTSVGKPNFVILGDPNSIDNLEIITTKLASWGIASVAYNMTYNSNPIRVPGKNLTPEQIIVKGNCFPEIISVLQDSGNYAQQASDVDNINGGYIRSIGWNYDYKSSTTGTSALEFNQDTVQAILDILRNAKDMNGVNLSDKCNVVNRFGVFGRSGGSNAMSGAHMINKKVPGTFISGVGQDIVLTLPFWGFDGTKEDLRGGSGNANDVTYTFPGGLNYPILFVEPEIDWYQPQDDQFLRMRQVVGARKSLQNLIRKTDILVRARTIYMEGPITGHRDLGPYLWSQDVGYKFITGRGSTQPDKPRWPDVYKDSVYGFSDLSNNRANISQALLNAMCLYFRVFQSNFESISSAMFNYVPFKFDQCPWNIPGADDYQWNYRFYRKDVGGVFNQRLDFNSKYKYVFEGILNADIPNSENIVTITDPTIDVIQVNTQYSKLNGNEIGDADVYLLNQKGQLVSGAVTAANPEYLYYDLSNIAPQDRLGDWIIFGELFQGVVKYTTTVELGHWKLVFDSQYNYNQVNTNPQFSLNNKTINIVNIPKSADGLVSGDIWNDNGILKIVS
jgi:hypothetical protein